MEHKSQMYYLYVAYDSVPTDTTGRLKPTESLLKLIELKKVARNKVQVHQ